MLHIYHATVLRYVIWIKPLLEWVFFSFGIVVVEVINEAIHFKRQKPFTGCQLVLQIEQMSDYKVSGADNK